MKISYSTVACILCLNGIYAYAPIKKPLLTAKHKLARLEFAKSVLFMSDNDVRRTIWSDESKFNLLYSDGKASVWRKPNCGLEDRCLEHTKKFGGGSVMVWACFSYNGIGRLEFIDGAMDSIKYIDILSRSLFDSAEVMGLDSFISSKIMILNTLES